MPSCSCRSCCIIAFALYPQAALEDGEQAVRGEASVLSEVRPETVAIR